MTRSKKNTTRVIRGGGWRFNAPWFVSAANRNSFLPAFRGNFNGFRTSLTVRQPR